MKIKVLFWALVLSLSLIANLSADIIKFKDGRELVGIIIGETESSLKVKTSTGVSVIGKGKIQEIIRRKETGISTSKRNGGRPGAKSKYLSAVDHHRHSPKQFLKILNAIRNLYPELSNEEIGNMIATAWMAMSDNTIYEVAQGIAEAVARATGRKRLSEVIASYAGIKEDDITWKPPQPSKKKQYEVTKKSTQPGRNSIFRFGKTTQFVEHGYCYLQGIVHNDGNQVLRYVKIKVFFYDRKKKLLRIEETYTDPHNIPPKGSATFSIMVKNFSFKTYTTKALWE